MPPTTLIIRNDDFVTLKSMSITMKLKKPPQRDRINAVMPLVKNTNTDFKITIANAHDELSSDIAVMTERFEKPGFTPSGRGIIDSTAEMTADNDSKMPVKAVLYTLFIGVT